MPRASSAPSRLPPHAHVRVPVPTAENVVYYANLVRDKAVIRGLIHTGTEIVRDACVILVLTATPETTSTRYGGDKDHETQEISCCVTKWCIECPGSENHAVRKVLSQ